jgi:hypothetical protein
MGCGVSIVDARVASRVLDGDELAWDNVRMDSEKVSVLWGELLATGMIPTVGRDVASGGSSVLAASPSLSADGE